MKFDEIELQKIISNTVAETLKQLGIDKKDIDYKNTPNSISRIESFLLSIGILYQYAGFDYLKTALFFMLTDPSFVKTPLYKKLYVEVAKEYPNCSIAKVERGIRYAKEKCFELKTPAFKEVFGDTISLTNKNFLMILYRVLSN